VNNSLTPEELEGAYRKLCGAMLVQTALSLSTRAAHRKDDYGEEMGYQKEASRRWLDGGVGRITFEEACDAVDMAPDYVRNGMEDYLSSSRRFKKRPWMRRNGGARTFLPITPVDPESSPS
jgi:hypothetical protein